METAHLRLPGALAVWTREGQSPGFAAAAKRELEALGPTALPLAALSGTGHTADTPISVAVLAASMSGGQLRLVLGVQFDEILPGCSCGEEPEPEPAYGELELVLDLCTAEARIAVVSEHRPE